MEIDERQLEDSLELAVRGRLDFYWADHLAARLSDVIQKGHHRLRLNLSATSISVRPASVSLSSFTNNCTEPCCTDRDGNGIPPFPKR